MNALDFKNLYGVTWCEDRINKSDLVFYSQQEMDRAREKAKEDGRNEILTCHKFESG